MKFGGEKRWEGRNQCNLCGKTKDQVRKLIVGLYGAVCSDCLELSMEILSNDGPRAPTPQHFNTETPGSSLAADVLYANQMLPRAGLVTMHSGNASGYDPEADLVLIKPSGVDYEALTLESLVPVDLFGNRKSKIENVESLRPSVDLPHHLFLYRNLPGVRGIVHTHSNYATAFAALGRAIPCVLTAIADEFGGPIPCAPYVDNEGDHIGEAILRHKNDRAPAILLANHGVFAWGDSPRAALKAAIMVEDIARTVWLAMQIEEPYPMPKGEIEKWWDRYQNRYGQS
jgi:L-ribulose-5-phosphate 4-epimerase